LTVLLCRQLPTSHAGIAGGAEATLFAPAAAAPAASFQMQRWRLDLGRSLEGCGARVGVEFGVWTGHFSVPTLADWQHRSAYYMANVWEPLDNYLDRANVGVEEHLRFLAAARERTREFRNSTRVLLPMSTMDASTVVWEASVDLVYVDARHEECAMLEDLAVWCPKVGPGGVFAGHDFLSAAEVARRDIGQDWSLCEDGSRRPGAVKGAVLQFANQVGATVTANRERWPSWIMLKPRRPPG